MYSWSEWTMYFDSCDRTWAGVTMDPKMEVWRNVVNEYVNDNLDEVDFDVIGIRGVVTEKDISFSVKVRRPCG